MSKVWMITGAGRGLGRAFAEEAAARGDRVIAGVRNPSAAEGWPENVLPVRMDVTKPEETVRSVREGVEQFGRIDVLVNNAGFGMSGAFEEVTEQELRTLMETDYFGVVNVTKAVLPVMRGQNSGMILNVASQAGLTGYLGSSAYCSAKFAVVGLSLALRMELAPFGIQVSAVCPGSFRTDFRDSSSIVIAGNPMKEYDGTPVRDSAKFLTAHNHMQEGDPKKAARFLYEIVESGTLPGRILVGKKCCEDILNELTLQMNEIHGYIAASSQTEYDT